jgi:hypothetical protein
LLNTKKGNQVGHHFQKGKEVAHLSITLVSILLIEVAILYWCILLPTAVPDTNQQLRLTGHCYQNIPGPEMADETKMADEAKLLYLQIHQLMNIPFVADVIRVQSRKLIPLALRGAWIMKVVDVPSLKRTIAKAHGYLDSHAEPRGAKVAKILRPLTQLINFYPQEAICGISWPQMDVYLLASEAIIVIQIPAPDGRFFRSINTTVIPYIAGNWPRDEDIIDKITSQTPKGFLQTLRLSGGPENPEEKRQRIHWDTCFKKTCGHCLQLQDKALQKCSRCRAIGYCGPGCQRSDWMIHKEQCVQMKFMTRESRLFL